MKYLRFIVAALLWLAVMEFWFSFQVRHDFSNWLSTIFINLAIFSLFYLLFRKIEKKHHSLIYSYILFGLLGLMSEWFIVGNAPWINPSANQFTMFTYWGGGVLIGSLFSDQDQNLKRIRRKFLKYFVPYGIMGTLMGFILFNQDPGIRAYVFLLYAAFGYDLVNIHFMEYLAYGSKKRKLF